MRLLARAARDERGIALVLALGVMFVLALSSVAIIDYATSNSGSATRSNADQSAFALAEAGINTAMAVLSLPTNNAGDPNLLPPPPPSPSARTDTYETGTATWGGTLSGTRWTVRSVGSVLHRNGGATTYVKRTTTATADLVPNLTQPLGIPGWNWVYAKQPGGGCNLEVENSVIIDAPFYVNGNLCLDNSATIQRATGAGETTKLVVAGKLTLEEAGNRVGTSAAPIAEAHVTNGCQWQSNPTHSPCSSADNVFASLIDGSPPSVSAPVADYAYWYQNAAPGPAHPCTTTTGTPPTFENETVGPTRNNSVPGVFNLTPSSSYTCQYVSGGQVRGELSWNASTRTLAVAGTVYIDGSVQMSGNNVNRYNGQATLYLSGTFRMSNGSKLCAALAGSNCDFSTWDPNARLLTIVADGDLGGGRSIELRNSAQFQGALYATNAIRVRNSAQTDGPMAASTFEFENSARVHAFPPIATVPMGQPGNPITFWQVSPPANYSG